MASRVGGGRVGAVEHRLGPQADSAVSQRGCEIISFIYGGRVSVAAGFSGVAAAGARAWASLSWLLLLRSTSSKV